MLRLQEHQDDVSGIGRGPAHRRCGPPGRALEGAALPENRHGFGHLVLEPSGQDAPVALDVQHPGLTHAGGAAVLPPRAVAEVRAGDGADPVRGHRGLGLGVHPDRRAQALRGGNHRGQRHDGLHPRIVMLATQAQRSAVHLETPHRGGKRVIEEFRQFGSHLAGICVDRVLADEHQVERPVTPQHRSQRPRRGKSVGAGENAVRDEDAVVCAGRHAPAHHVLRRGRPQRDHGAASTRLPRQLDALAEGALAVRVHRKLDSIPLEPSVRPQFHGLEPRDLLDERCDAKGLHDRSSFQSWVKNNLYFCFTK